METKKLTLENYRKTTFSEIRAIFKERKVTEDEFRCSLYDNNSCSKQNDGIERFVQRIFHPSIEDIREESDLGL